ncbi:MAG: calcineurin-like phosphoesterase family protein [Opitutales bacterium]|nr:calcineurin-like phosphoesterase family protein [Opitutales bacterium]
MEKKPTTEWSRRDFLRRSGQFSVAALGGMAMARNAVAAPAADADGIARARGTVFLDANGTGLAEGQRGLAGVLVSNGVDIVETDRDGRYELPVTDDTILHVIKPRGYRTTIDALNLPRFYYIHKPDGSPDSDFLYKGVEPTGPLPERVDFPLYARHESDTFEVLVTADPQPYNLQHLQWYAEETTREFRSRAPAFGIALGDIVGDHLDLFGPYNEINAKCGFPWHNVFGNHDLNFMAREDRYADETFKRVFGPSTYAFQYARVHFIILNNVFWEGFTRMRADGWPRRGQYKGHIRPEQFTYIRNYLRHVPADERIVVCSHIPMVNQADADGKHGTPEFGELLRLLSGHRYTMSLSGHTHINMNYFLGGESGYRPPGGHLHHHCNLTATCGSWYRGPLDDAGVPFAPGRDGSPKGYAVVRFEGGERYNVHVKGLRRPDGEQMAVHVPSLVERAKLGETEVQVNVFAGSVRTRVRMRIDDGQWVRLAQTEGVDRRYLALRERAAAHPDAGEGQMPEPLVTDHKWTAALPADLGTGWHTLTVEVRGTFGEDWSEKRTFVVAENAADLDSLSEGTRTVREA